MALPLEDYRHFRLDGMTEEEFHAQPLPETITIQLTKVAAIGLTSDGFCQDRSPEYIAAKVLDDWAHRKLSFSRALLEPSEPEEKEPRAELGYQREVIKLLTRSGLCVRGQVPTESGVADVVIYDGEKPKIVLELKASFKNRRSALQASGQATAYAKALGAIHCLLSAPEFSPELVGETPGCVRIVSADALVNEVRALMEDKHVVSIADRR